MYVRTAYEQVARELKDPKDKGKLMRLHKSVAVLLMGGIALRIGVRLASKIPAALPGPAIQQLAGTASHTAFYGLMLFMPISGITMVRRDTQRHAACIHHGTQCTRRVVSRG